MEPLKEKFVCFSNENPFQFTEEQLNKIKEDIWNPRKGIASDEYVDFVLWTKGLQSRQQYFANYIEKILPQNMYQKILEVGCGRTAALSQRLAQKGYEMTAMDPLIVPEQVAGCKVSCIKDVFVCGKTDIQEYDAVIAQEPCEATEHIIRACMEERKNYVISLCGTAHRLINGEMPEDVYAWYRYLQEIAPKNSALIYPDLIPGYLTPVMLGMFPT